MYGNVITVQMEEMCYVLLLPQIDRGIIAMPKAQAKVITVSPCPEGR